MVSEWMKRGTEAMGIVLSDEACKGIERYHEMLVEANKTMNLTRIADDPMEAVERSYLDSLTPLAVPGLMTGVRTLIDVGAGAGCPGIPLAIALPHVRVTLLDALGKRVKFLQSVIDELGLNACAIHARSEDAARDPSLREAFDCATARAVADTPVLLELGLPFVRIGGMMIAYKGPAVDEEMLRSEHAMTQLGGRTRAILPAPIPDRDWDHRLLIVDKRASTPKRYPRKAGEPGRKPL